MELYILDSAFKRTEVVESYESLIWTERFNDVGDFELVIDPSLADYALRQAGTYLAIDKSQRVMVIDTVEDKFNDNGYRMYLIKGRSLEDILNHRTNRYYDGTAMTVSGAPATYMRNLVQAICNPPGGSPAELLLDKLTYLQSGSYNSADSIAEPSTPTITTADSTRPSSSPGETENEYATITTLFNEIKMIADTYSLGFRFVRPSDNSMIYFEVHTGSDRTTGQSVRAPVVFGTEFENISNLTEIKTSAFRKDVAYVIAPNGKRVVYSPNAASGVSGWGRKVMIVDAKDITLPAGSALNAELDKRGLYELAFNTAVFAIDGEVTKNASYVYGTDYKLGDLVEQRGSDGAYNVLRVTEHIFISDGNGEQSYPTLSFQKLVTTGTWDAVLPSVVWDTYTTETWSSI